MQPLMKLRLVILLLLASSALMAQELVGGPPSASSSPQPVYQGFSGGMMLHSGYLFGIDGAAPEDASGSSYSTQGAPIGVGGALRVHLWKLLRVGFEGSVSTLHAGMSDQHDRLQPGSYTRIGSGGVSADACWRKDKVWPYVGATIGGGAMRSLYIVDGNQSDWTQENETYFHRQGFFCVTPYVGCDYCATPKLHLTFRLDWMVAVRQSALVMPTGPRIYFGLMFTH